jgi:HAD superfamily hydrolase (TIGR01450 family)
MPPAASRTFTLEDARGFMFDLDGTLVHRARGGGATAIPGAVDVIAAIRASNRPLVVFTNATHIAPAALAAVAHDAGIDLREREVLTPLASAAGFIQRRHPGARVFVLATGTARELIASGGIAVVDEPGAADVVFVGHVESVDLAVLEGAARAVLGGARLLVGSYAPAYAGADGPILSRGAMVAAAVARASGRRPTIVGKPSRAAVREVGERLGVAPRDVAFIGDDLTMDIALGRLAGARTVLVASGISGRDVNGRHRPDLVVGHVGELLGLL